MLIHIFISEFHCHLPGKFSKRFISTQY